MYTQMHRLRILESSVLLAIVIYHKIRLIIYISDDYKTTGLTKYLNKI